MDKIFFVNFLGFPAWDPNYYNNSLAERLLIYLGQDLIILEYQKRTDHKFRLTIKLNFHHVKIKNEITFFIFKIFYQNNRPSTKIFIWV